VHRIAFAGFQNLEVRPELSVLKISCLRTRDVICNPFSIVTLAKKGRRQASYRETQTFRPEIERFTHWNLLTPVYLVVHVGACAVQGTSSNYRDAAHKQDVGAIWSEFLSMRICSEANNGMCRSAFLAQLIDYQLIKDGFFSWVIHADAVVPTESLRIRFPYVEVVLIICCKE
jgi:hypothetical protein